MIEITRFFCQIAIQNSSYRDIIVHIGWFGLVAQYKDFSDAVGTLFGNLFYSEVVFFTDILQNNSFFEKLSSTLKEMTFEGDLFSAATNF